MMDKLNVLFQNNGSDFRFYMACPRVITDDDILNTNDWESFWNEFGGDNTNANAVNVHVVQQYTGGGGVYNSLGDFIVVERAGVPAVSV